LGDTGEFVFNPAQHNPNAGRCLGFDLAALKGQGLAQGRKVLDLVARDPATATFVCAKLCRRLFGDTPPAPVVERAVAAWNAYYDSPTQIKHVMHAILLGGPEIGQGPLAKVRRPHERIVAFARGTDATVKPDPIWTYLLRNAHDAPFGWLTPDGRPDTNEFWLSPAINVETWNQVTYLNGSPTYFTLDILAQTPADALKSPTLFVEYWVGRMIGYALTPAAMSAPIAEAAKYVPGFASYPKEMNSILIANVLAIIAVAPEFANR
jgi:hypothetical protein